MPGIAVRVVGYLVAAFSLLFAVYSASTLQLGGAVAGLVIACAAIVACNPFGIRSRIPWLGDSDRTRAMAGWAVLIVGGIALAIFVSLNENAIPAVSAASEARATVTAEARAAAQDATAATAQAILPSPTPPPPSPTREPPTATPEPPTATPQPPTATPRPPSPTAPPTAPPATPTPAPVAPAAIVPIPTPAAGALYDVVDVVDGDTIKVRSASGQVETLRLIGIDTPEVVDPRTPVQCFGREASNRAKELLTGKRVRLEQDPTQDTRDRYGRLLAYVWLEDGTFFNKQMIVDGYAQEYTYNTPYRFQAEFKAAQQQARDAQRGLWAPDTCNGDTSQPATTAATPRSGPASNVTPAPPTATARSTVAPATGPVQIVSAAGARPGGTARVTAKAPPGASCSIIYTTPAGASSTAQGLVPKTADPAGNVAWTWSIGPGTRPGTGTVAVTCNGVTARTDITIG